MIRREAWEALGGFDESFHPLWFEDVDFLKRIRQRGYRTVYVPQAVARHGGGHSVKRLPRECREAYWYASLLRYAAKHFRPLEMRAVCAAMVLGCLLRVVAGVLWERNLNLLTVYSKVIRLASIRLLHGRSGEADRSPILARH
jgi:N-acetylglucosaminyl-diphospho-decaprenol L-rhamnosyltransferase